MIIVRTALYGLWFYYSQIRFKLFDFPIFQFGAYQIKLIPETRYVLLVLCRRTGAHRGDCFFYSRNVLCFIGLVPEDRCSSWGLFFLF